MSDKVLKGFFVIEGLDGSGTTTQLDLIAKALEQKKIKVFPTFEPSPSPLGNFIRDIQKGNVKVSPLTLAYLYAADRENHLNQKGLGIVSKLSEGWIVISDRYVFSSYAYQSLSVPFEKVKSLNRDFPFPEAVIFLDTPAKECMQRIGSRGGKAEIFEKLSTLTQVKNAYEKAFLLLPQDSKLYRFDGTLPKEELCQRIMEQVFHIKKVASP